MSNAATTDPQNERVTACAACEAPIRQGYATGDCCVGCALQALLDDGEAEWAIALCGDYGLPFLEVLGLYEAGALAGRRSAPSPAVAWAMAA